MAELPAGVPDSGERFALAGTVRRSSCAPRSPHRQQFRALVGRVGWTNRPHEALSVRCGGGLHRSGKTIGLSTCVPSTRQDHRVLIGTNDPFSDRSLQSNTGSFVVRPDRPPTLCHLLVVSGTVPFEEGKILPERLARYGADRTPAFMLITVCRSRRTTPQDYGLAEYILRCLYSLARVDRLTDEGSMIYRAEKGPLPPLSRSSQR